MHLQCVTNYFPVVDNAKNTNHAWNSICHAYIMQKKKHLPPVENYLPRVYNEKCICHAWQTICNAYIMQKTFTTHDNLFSKRI